MTRTRNQMGRSRKSNYRIPHRQNGVKMSGFDLASATWPLLTTGKPYSDNHRPYTYWIASGCLGTTTFPSKLDSLDLILRTKLVSALDLTAETVRHMGSNRNRNTGWCWIMEVKYVIFWLYALAQGMRGVNYENHFPTEDR